MILAIDQGTTGTTCLVFDERAEPIGRAYREFTQHFPEPGLGRARRARDLGGDARGRGRGARRRRVGSRGARGGGHHQPARDRVRVGPGHRRAAAQRDRLAGPPHGRALRRAARGRGTSRSCARAPASCSTPTSRAPRSSGCSSTWRGCASGRSRAGGLRHGRLLALVQAHRRARHRRLQRVAHDALRHRRRALGPRAAGAARRSRAGAARACCRARGPGRDAARGAPRPRGPGGGRRRATSRRPCSARRAWIRAWARTPTERARSCC